MSNTNNQRVGSILISTMLMLCIGGTHAQHTAATDSSTAPAQVQAHVPLRLFEDVAVPKNDLVIVRTNRDEDTLFVMTNTQGLGQMLGHARMMSMIPPSSVTFYLNGYPIDRQMLALFVDKKASQKARYASADPQLVPAKRKQQIFQDDSWAYTEKRALLQKTPGRYILEQDVVEELYYLDVVLPAVSELRNLLREKRGFVLKGEHASYRIGEFRDFLLADEPGVRTEWETPSGQELLQLRLYIKDRDELSQQQLFTQQDAQTLLGHQYFLKTSARYNKTFKLMWLEYEYAKPASQTTAEDIKRH